MTPGGGAPHQRREKARETKQFLIDRQSRHRHFLRGSSKGGRTEGPPIAEEYQVQNPAHGEDNGELLCTQVGRGPAPTPPTTRGGTASTTTWERGGGTAHHRALGPTYTLQEAALRVQGFPASHSPFVALFPSYLGKNYFLNPAKELNAFFNY